MTEEQNLRWQLICAWCGPAFVVLFLTFWGWIGGNLPPAGPSLSAEEIAAYYRAYSVTIRIGFVGAVVFMCLYMPWSAVLSARMARIEGKMRSLAYLQLIGGGLTGVGVSMGAAFWIAAAFRPERSPEITQMLHDVGWLTIDQLYFCTTLQMIAGAVVGLYDKSDRPLFPRWVCWYAIWAGFTFLPASLTAFVKTGAFAWSGIGSYYFPYFAWLSWFGLFSFFLIRNIRREMADTR